nr:hypothetical protein [Tanacetum cinerariifolium]
MPPSIEDDEDSEGDILFLERLIHDDPIPLPDTLDFSYEVRIFLPFFTYPPGLSHRCGTFKKFNTHRSHLNESPMEMLFSTCPPWTNEFGVESGLRLGLLHLVGSQPMLKSSYKAEAGVIISIPPLVGGVADVVVEIKGTGWSISITFRFSVGLQTSDDLSRSRLGFIEKMGVKENQEKDKIGSKPDKNGKRVEAEKSLKQLQWKRQEKLN